MSITDNTIENAKEKVLSYYCDFIDQCHFVHGIDLTTIISDCVTAGYNACAGQPPIPSSQPLPTGSENKTYNFEIEGEQVSVTGDEIRKFYGDNYTSPDAFIEKTRAKYTARIKYYSDCESKINKELVQRLLDEERLMKVGESDSFKLQLHFDWFVRIRKQSNRFTKYYLKAYCLDNTQIKIRGFETLDAAMLYCLNGFNENASIRNKYCTIDEYLSEGK